MGNGQYNESPVWQSLSHKHRCQIVGKARGHLVDAADELTEACASEQRTDPVETISSELLPLASALRRIERCGGRLLRSRRCGLRGRPLWLWGLRSEVRRVPHGDVLILGTWNYPLLLMGVQAGQALAAGNRVMLKPAPGCERATELMVRCFYRAGVPQAQLVQLDSSTESAVAAIRQGVDLIVLTGSAATGRKVLSEAAQTLTPTIMELSGCDAVIVTPTADIERATEAIVFGLNFNAGATCIGPRRLIVEQSISDELVGKLAGQLADCKPATIHPAARSDVAEGLRGAIERGARDVLRHFNEAEFLETGTLAAVVLDSVPADDPIASADLFAPITSVIRVPQIAQAVQFVNRCPYRLAASIFGRPDEAAAIADRLDVGSIAINDLLVPTADPRLPFGGRGDSGFGVTRGDEGLLSMTVPKVISRRRGGFMPHLAPRRASDDEALRGMLGMLYSGSLGQRWQGLRRIVRAVKTD